MKFWRRRKHKDAELDEEIRGHIEEAIRERVERGESPEEARSRVLAEFGNVTLVKVLTRGMWSWSFVERLSQDLRFGLRMLRRAGDSLWLRFSL